MGVHIGDERIFVFPGFIDAACEELLEITKNNGRKFNERFILSVQSVQGKTEKFRAAVLRQNAAAKKKNAGGNFLPDAFVYTRALWSRLLFLDVKKAGDS